jgi:hypothetical protein
MDDTTILGGVLGQLGQTAKKIGQQVVKLPEEMSKDAGEQIAGTKSADSTQVPSEQPKQENKSQWSSDEERINFLKGLYGDTKPLSGVDKLSDKDSSVKKQTTSANPLINAVEKQKSSEFQEQIADKSPDEQKKIMELRNQLHKEVYYDPIFNPPKKQEERPAEKVENEKKQEMMELQKKEEKKPTNWAVVREQNKAEQFRGAAG